LANAHQQHEKLWTPANVVTLLRICFIPLFVIAIISPWPTWFPQWHDAEIWKPWVAAAVFIVLAATDSLDGYLARSRGEVTNLGKFMDPLADKILVAAALLALIELSVLPSWVALVILTREFIVSGIRMVAASQGVVIAASWYGKAKTVTQIVAIVLFIIKDSHMVADFSTVISDRMYLFSWFVMIIALVLTIVSMLDYFVKARELLGFTKKPKSGRTPEGGAEAGRSMAISTEQAAAIMPDALADLAAAVLDEARGANLTVGTAESCTGGLIAGTMTAVPGSSDVVAGGIVSYSNEVKNSVLGVRKLTLDTYGAVSEETACEMARGAREKLAVDIAVSVTGIAGPGGAVPGKPVGTVWIGLSDSNITLAEVRHFDGTREQVRLQTVKSALDLMRKAVSAQSQEA
jgi:CDP-diacylglycerol--glycerol-3-phosphate 3-phosphatidyltransferase